MSNINMKHDGSLSSILNGKNTPCVFSRTLLTTPSPKRRVSNGRQSQSSVRVTSFYSQQARRRTPKNKQHDDRAPHLDRTNGVLLYHTTLAHGAQVGRGQVRSTRCVRAFFLLLSRVCACVLRLTLLYFHSEAEGAICGEQKDQEIEPLVRVRELDRGYRTYHIV